MKAKVMVEETNEGGDNNNDLLQPHPIKQLTVFIKVSDFSSTIYTDQTGKFPVPSSHSNKYVMTMVETESKYINSEQMKNKTATEVM